MEIELVGADGTTTIKAVADEESEYSADENCTLYLYQPAPEQGEGESPTEENIPEKDEETEPAEDGPSPDPSDLVATPEGQEMEIELTPDAVIALADALNRWIKRRRKDGAHV